MHPFAAAVLVALLAPQPAPLPGADPPPPETIDLSWNAPAECPSAADVEDLYRAMLSSAPLGEGTLVANARVRQDAPGRWLLRLTTTFAGATHTRELEATACDALAEAVAIVFAVALEPSLAHEPEPATPAATETPPDHEGTAVPTAPRAGSAPAVAPRAPDRRVSTPSPSAPRSRTGRAPTLVARVSLGGERGALPGVAAMPQLGLGLQWQRAQIEADLGWFSPRSISVSAPPSASLRAQSVHGALRACVALHDGGLRVPFCFGAEAGRVFARSRGLPDDAQVRGPWFALGPRVGVAYRWRRVGVALAGEALRSVVTTRLRVEEAPIFAPAAFSVRALASLELFFSIPRP